MKDSADGISLFKTTLICIGCAFAITVSINIPVIGMFTCVLASPIGIIFPDLVESGHDVEFWFFGFFIKTLKGWLIYITYFYGIISVIVYPIVILAKIANAILKRIAQ